MTARWALRFVLLGFVASALAVFWDLVPPMRGYLNPLPAASVTTFDIRLVPPFRTQRYDASDDLFSLHKFKFLGHTRRWHSHVPQTTAMPNRVIVLLHGSGRNGASMIDMWQAAADRHGFTLIAPDARETAGWSQIKDGGRFMARLVAHAQSELGFAADEWYLFGHSAGAVHAMTLVQSGSVSWNAVAVHAGGPSPGRVHPGIRPVPYRSYIGDSDQLFSVPYIKQGVVAIAQAGHPTELVIMQDHGHWFYDVGPLVADDAAKWFLGRVR